MIDSIDEVYRDLPDRDRTVVVNFLNHITTLIVRSERKGGRSQM